MGYVVSPLYECALGALSASVWPKEKNIHRSAPFHKIDQEIGEPYDPVILIQTGAITASSTAAVTLQQATDTAGTSAKALGFTKMFTNDGNVSLDTLVETAVTSNTFNLDTANAVYQIEIDADELDTANGFTAFNLNIASPGSNDFLVAAQYMLTDGRTCTAPGSLPSVI